MPENQTAWNSDNQRIKEKINQNNQTSKAADHTNQLRKTTVTWRTLGVGLAAVRRQTEQAGLTVGETETQS